MTARVGIMVLSSGVRGTITALLELGYTWCVVSPQVVEKLGLRLRKLSQSWSFPNWTG